LIFLRSTGKSALFENQIQSVSHNLSCDDGCGRFNTAGKLILLLHDVNLNVLVKGKDVDKLKAVTRSEPFTAKVHSSTVTVPPIHLLVTSNRYFLHLYINTISIIIFNFFNEIIFISDIC